MFELNLIGLMHILVTGGAGYIGSQFIRLLSEKRSNILAVDNLSRGHIESLPVGVDFENADLTDFMALNGVFKKHRIEEVVHFAALAYVGESIENPALYYKNNLMGSMNLLNACVENGVKKMIFSSTCSVYGDPRRIPVSEAEPLNPINPYARTKTAVEGMLRDYDRAFGLKYISLRYFNAAGADGSGEIGHSHSPETRLIPIVIKTAVGQFERVDVYGDDYDTPDGTCIRDYIHVEDLAGAHFSALEYLDNNNKSDIFNLGTGTGYSVREIIDAVEKETGRGVNFRIVDRRPGDPAVLVADNSKAKKILEWEPKKDLSEIIRTSYNWILNPKY